ncbi:hypothetical protein BH10ACI4_BH10ACI4_27890 [soil metagenome]
MEVASIIAQIDTQIAKLQQARALLAGTKATVSTGVGRGRPKGSKNVKAVVAATTTTKKTTARKLSPEGRKRIADAMKKRWAERRKQSAKG